MCVFDRFEFKAQVLFTGYRDRSRLMDEELARVGMDGVYKIWNFPCKFDGVLQKQIAHVRMMDHAGFFNSVIGHYRAIKTAYCLGCNSCLVMEDDIRFLSDGKTLDEIVGDIPEGYDIALFDVLKPKKVPIHEFLHHLKADKASKYWVRFVNARSAGCYALSRKAMKRWIDALESPAVGSGGKMRLADQYFNIAHVGFDLNAYHASPVAARQVLIGTGVNNSCLTEIDSWYASIGCGDLKYGK